MDKFLVEVRSPAANRSYDMMIPSNMQIGELASLVSGVFSETSNGIYKYTGSCVVCDGETGTALDPNKTAKELKIRNGTKLILF